jgi:hypothetical protein
MKARQSVLGLAAAATLALGAQAAQAHLLFKAEGATSATVASGRYAVSVLEAAGIRYHAAANYRNELRLVPSVPTGPWAFGGARPDDRSVPRI